MEGVGGMGASFIKTEASEVGELGSMIYIFGIFNLENTMRANFNGGGHSTYSSS